VNRQVAHPPIPADAILALHRPLQFRFRVIRFFQHGLAFEMREAEGGPPLDPPFLLVQMDAQFIIDIAPPAPVVDAPMRMRIVFPA